MFYQEINSLLQTLKLKDLFQLILKKATIVPVDFTLRLYWKDPDDDIVLSTALNGKADYIVSGDKHLLALKKFEKIEIMKVNQMLEILS